MAGISEAAHDEVHRRHPVWRDSGAGIKQGIRYRQGFIAGAEWADAHTRSALDQATERASRATEEMKAYRATAAMQASIAAGETAAREASLASRETAAAEALATARDLSRLEEANRLNPLTYESHQRLVLEVADIISAAPIHVTSEGHSIVGDPVATARDVLNFLIAAGYIDGGSESLCRDIVHRLDDDS